MQRKHVLPGLTRNKLGNSLDPQETDGGIANLMLAYVLPSAGLSSPLCSKTHIVLSGFVGLPCFFSFVCDSCYFINQCHHELSLLPRRALEQQ